MERKIVLASTSPRRKELLEKTGIPFEICAGNYEEDMTLPLAPKELAKHLSKGKAESISGQYDDAIIIGADTFVAYNGKVLGKPHTSEKAKEMLKMLRGTTHSIITGFTLIDTRTHKIVSDTVETVIFFKNYSDTDIDSYVATGEPLDRAGGYALQGLGKTLVEKIEGDYSSAIGLPVDRIVEELKSFED